MYPICPSYVCSSPPQPPLWDVLRVRVALAHPSPNQIHARLSFGVQPSDTPTRMSSIFEAYDEEFLALTQDIGTNISHLTTYETDAGEASSSSACSSKTSCSLAVRCP